MNLSLRKELCEALGWTRGDRFWHHPWCVEDSGCVTACGGSGDDSLPEYESNATLSEELLDSECRKNGWRAEESFDPTRGAGYEYSITLERVETFETVVNDTYGTKRAEARAKALLSALRKSQ